MQFYESYILVFFVFNLFSLNLPQFWTMQILVFLQKIETVGREYTKKNFNMIEKAFVVV